ncbi:chemotaxis protein CheW [Azospirillum soli]|uniref:chemotaxis protein CheW n=1 Tax=Azospirillum soli TaxID=1304799 RepID=UPI001AE5C3C9|nr:chemotaxis protein CheW [Azospirillum soli]MBP2315632.1 purine-binding chemotaxis protein CheW [Azospirillum soli]
MAAIVRQDGARPFVTFGVGDMALAVPLAEVLEILRPPEVVRIPLGPPSLEGLARHRGEVMPVISLRRILGLPDAEREAGARVLVARHRGQPVGLVADRINGLASVGDDRIVAAEGVANGTGAAIDEALLAGAIRATDGGEGALILDIGPVVERQFADLGRIAGRAGGFGGGIGGGSGEAAPIGRDAAVSVDEVRLVVFAAAGQEFALPVEHVQEIGPVPNLVTRVPRARAHLLGMMTLRDALLPLVGLRELFGLDETGEETGRRVVVVRTDEGLVGVVVDGVREILRTPHGRIDPVPPLLAREAEFEDVSGIARVDGNGRLVSVLSAARLFRRGAALGTGTNGEGAGMVVGDEAAGLTTQGRTEPFVVFRLAGAEYGLPVAAVREVLRRPDAPTPLPNAPDFVRGVVTLRGAVLPVIDQRRLLRLPEVATGGGERARVVVIAAGEALAGLLVDGMAGIVRVPESRIETAPVVSQAQHRLIRRVATLDDPGAPDGRRMILLMDPGELLDMDQLAALLVAA